MNVGLARITGLSITNVRLSNTKPVHTYYSIKGEKHL